MQTLVDTRITPFTASVPQQALDDLMDRLARTRFADDLPDAGWSDGVPAAFVRELVDHWRTGFDWRAWEAKLNAWPQFTTEIDGQTIHFLHVRSREANAFPIILTHGWPMSVFEYVDLIGPLTDPVAHGGRAEDAFDVVIPSVPGVGFSGPTTERGWSRYRTARAWAELMRRLGYERYGAAGNDGGSLISPEVGRVDPDRVAGVHVTQIFSFPSGDPTEMEGLSEEEQAALEHLAWFWENMGAFNLLQSSQPQTLAHALADSPAGLLGWVAQLFGEAVPRDYILANATLYWLTNTGPSSIRFYREDKLAEAPTGPTSVPIGLAGFANDFVSIRRFAERDHQQVAQWHQYDTGGHHASVQAPEVLIDDMRGFFGGLR